MCTVLVVITVAAIVFFLPRNSGPQFRYDIGKPWMYSSLIAKFDFPIYKTEETIKEEQDSISDAFEPYYNYNPDVEKKEVELPDVIRSVVKCGNPKCITNNEPMATVFQVVDKEQGIIQCAYCEKEQNIDHVKLL